MKSTFKIIPYYLLAFLLLDFYACRKDKVITDPSATLEFSQDSVLFDTVFTSIGSSTQNIRVRNKHNQKIKISSIWLEKGSGSQFIINVDGTKGPSVNDIEIAANDSLYIFIQVNVNPNNAASPLIVEDAIHFNVNGNEQKVILEAWGQDAYYHRATNAIKFQDGSYISYSLCDTLKESFTKSGSEIVWKNDKPHVIYGYLVVDSLQRLRILAGTKLFFNYKAGLWVYRYGQLRVQGQKGNEVTFQGARREKDFADEPGQWDRIWINEGSDNNIIDYAIIKNGYIGVQTELMGNGIFDKGTLRLTNTKIQNMSKWGFYGLGYKVYAGNNVISNCQEHCVNVQVGGSYKFYHCTFVNFWNKGARTLATININNYTSSQVIWDTVYFGNCIIDGKLSNEISLDVKSSGTITPVYAFSNSWLKTTADISDANKYINVKKESSSLNFKDSSAYDFQPKMYETRHKGFVHLNATKDAQRFPKDILQTARNTSSVTAGAYEN